MTTGGGALQDAAVELAAGLRDALPDAVVALVRGPYAQFEPPPGVELVDAPSSLLAELLAADVVVTAAGQTALESAATGAATIALPLAPNQRANADPLRRGGRRGGRRAGRRRGGRGAVRRPDRSRAPARPPSTASARCGSRSGSRSSQTRRESENSVEHWNCCFHSGTARDLVRIEDPALVALAEQRRRPRVEVEVRPCDLLEPVRGELVGVRQRVRAHVVARG